MRTALVFTGGDDPGQAHANVDADLVIAADSGLEHALARSIHVDVVVGDLDSASPRVLSAAHDAGARIDRHPADKDATDLALALDAAMDAGMEHVVVIGGAGGRLDHFVANTLILAAERYAGLHTEARSATAGGIARVIAVRSRREVDGAVGELVSLLPVGGPATGVRTSGLHYALHGETLEPGSTRGVSNYFIESRAVVSVDTGVLLMITPGASPTAPDADVTG